VSTSPGIGEVFQQPQFRRIWAAGAVLSLMRWLDVLVLGVFVFELTGSAFSVALIFFFRLAPQLLLGMIIGTLADRISRKRLLLISVSALALIYFTVAMLIISGQIRYWQLAAAVFIAGMFITCDFPVRRALIADIMPPALLGRAASIDIATANIMRVAGPLLGGVLLQQSGAQGAYLLAALLFAGTIWCAATLTEPAAAEKPALPGNPLHELIAGLRYIRTSTIISSVLVVTIIMNMFGFSYTSLVSPIAIQVLGADALHIGILSSLEGCGAVLGSLLIATLAQSRHYQRLFFYGSMLFLLGILAFSRSHSYLLSACILFTGGFGIAGFSTMQTTILISACAPPMRGRVMGTLALCIGAQPLGALQVAWLSQILTLQNTVALMAGAGLLTMTLTAWWWPLLRSSRDGSSPSG
jgi:MFS family permease